MPVLLSLVFVGSGSVSFEPDSGYSITFDMDPDPGELYGFGSPALGGGGGVFSKIDPALPPSLG